MRVIVTGCAGFVGSNVMNRLKDANGVDDLSFGSVDNLSKDSRWTKMSFENIYPYVLNEFDVLIHCATANMIFAMEHPIKTFETNALKTIRLFDKFKGKIVYTSTASVYGNADIIPTPENAEMKVRGSYDMSKLLAEMFLQQRGNYTTLRLSNCYGINQRPTQYGGVIGKLIDQALSGQPMQVIGKGTQTRDFTFVDDVVDAIVMAVEQDAKNTEINIATGVETRIVDLATTIESILDRYIPTHLIPPRQIDYMDRRCLDITKAKSLLGWEPKHYIREGLEKTIKWMETQLLTSK